MLAICLLALTGHAEEATAVGLVGGAALAASGISVTINLRR